MRLLKLLLIVNLLLLFACQGDSPDALAEAASQGKIEVVKRLIANGADLKSTNNRNAIVNAAMGGHAETVKVLLDAGADVNTVGTIGATPLVVASRGGFDDVIDLLVAAKADVNAVDPSGLTPLMWASLANKKETVAKLIALGANVNTRTRDNVWASINQARFNGGSALSAAATNGYTDVVKILLEAKADKTIKDGKGRLPLDYAEEFKHIEVVKLLKDEATSSASKQPSQK